MTTEETHNFNIDNEGIKIVEDFAYRGSVINSTGDGSQDIKRRLKLGRTARRGSGKITKSKDVIRDHGYSHPQPCISDYSVEM